MSMSVSITVVGQDWADVRRQMAGILATPGTAGTPVELPPAATEAEPIEEKKKAGRPPKAKTEAPAAPAPSADPFADTPASPPPATEPVTEATVKEALKTYMAKHGMPAASDLLFKATGTKLFREIKPDQFQKVMDAITAAK